MSFKPNEKHWEIVLKYFEDNPNVATGRFTGPTGKIANRKHWETLSERLNSLGYGTKSSDKWQKTWTDFKYNLKKKASEIKFDMNKTGGGVPTTKVLNKLELRALALFGTSEVGVKINKSENQTEVPPTVVSTSSAMSLKEKINTDTNEDLVKKNEEVKQQSTSTSRFPKEIKVFSSATLDHSYNQKIKKKQNIHETYEETISILKDIHNTLDNKLTYLSDTVGQKLDAINSTINKRLEEIASLVENQNK